MNLKKVLQSMNTTLYDFIHQMGKNGRDTSIFSDFTRTLTSVLNFHMIEGLKETANHSLHNLHLKRRLHGTGEFVYHHILLIIVHVNRT